MVGTQQHRDQVAHGIPDDCELPIGLKECMPGMTPQVALNEMTLATLVVPGTCALPTAPATPS